VDWAGEQIASLSHAHAFSRQQLGAIVAAGYEHVAISNYYPSNPATSFPLSNLSAPGDVPDNVIAGPNAEHFDFSNTAGGHFCAIGSTFATGGPTSGYGKSWQEFVNGAVAAMIYPSAGGICINHPALNYCGDQIVQQMLDYNPAVLGLEIWNSSGDWYYSGRGWGVQAWHNILVTGRRCYGFGATDHWAQFGVQGTATTDANGRSVIVPPARGMNRLLLPSGFSALSAAEKERACLEAYFEGRSYVALEATSPRLVKLTADATSMTVAFDANCAIDFVWARPRDRAARTTSGGTGTSATYTRHGDEVYVRAVGTISAYEKSLTHPVMFIEQANL
jgi:hypothetical protein